MTPSQGAVQIKIDADNIRRETFMAANGKAFEASQIVRNHEIEVLTNESPSAPGSPPGIRSGNLRGNWTFGTEGQFTEYGGTITIKGESNAHYSGYLEYGTRKMAARPFADKIIESSEPDIAALFSNL